MQFLHPAYFALGFLALLPVVLYLFRRKSKTISVSTLVFFKSLAREHQESAWLRYLKKIFSLVMTLAVIGFAIFALARTVVAPEEGSLKGIVIVLDRSASMAATDADGKARLEAAKKEIRTRLDAVPESVGVALVAYDARPEVVQPLTQNRRQFLAMLEGIGTRPVEDDAAAAIAIGKRIAALEKPSAIWHVSDTPLGARRIISASQHARESAEEHRKAARPADEESAAAVAAKDIEPARVNALDPTESSSDLATPPDVPLSSPDAPIPELTSRVLMGEEDEGKAEEVLILPDGVSLKTINLGLKMPVNVGITSFQVRRLPRINSSSAYEAFVQVAASELAEASVEVTLETTIGGRPALVPDRITLKPGEKVTRIIALDGSEGQLLRFHLDCEGDCFSLDNDALALLPEERPIVVAWVTKSEDPFTQIALQSMVEEGELDVIKDSPENWPLEDDYDVVFFDGWMPEAWPTDRPAIVMNPNRSTGPVQIEPMPGGVLFQEEIRVTNDRHPLLFRISTSRITLGQTSRFTSLGSLTPLWLAENEPVLAAGEVNGRRLVVMNFSPEHSEYLRLSISWPLLLGNAVFWCLDDRETSTKPEQSQSGRVVNLQGGGTIEWTSIDPSTGEILTESQKTGGAEVAQLDRIGLWSQKKENGKAGMSGLSLLLSRHETNLGRTATISGEENALAGGQAIVEQEAADGSWLSGDLTWFLLTGLLVVLLLESWLFHRHAVY